MLMVQKEDYSDPLSSWKSQESQLSDPIVSSGRDGRR